jgi:hypothetical protein
MWLVPFYCPWLKETYQTRGGTADCMDVVINRTIKVLVLANEDCLRWLSKYLWNNVVTRNSVTRIYRKAHQQVKPVIRASATTVPITIMLA